MSAGARTRSDLAARRARVAGCLAARTRSAIARCWLFVRASQRLRAVGLDPSSSASSSGNVSAASRTRRDTWSPVSMPARRHSGSGKSRNQQSLPFPQRFMFRRPSPTPSMEISTGVVSSRRHDLMSHDGTSTYRGRVGAFRRTTVRTSTGSATTDLRAEEIVLRDPAGGRREAGRRWRRRTTAPQGGRWDKRPMERRLRRHPSHPGYHPSRHQSRVGP